LNENNLNAEDEDEVEVVDKKKEVDEVYQPKFGSVEPSEMMSVNPIF